MAENSAIEWTDHTFNPWIGCTKVSPACDHCYAETWDQRYNAGTHWGPKAERKRTSAQTWNQPRKWNRAAAENGIRYRVFCASLADVFDNKVPTEWRADLWHLIRETPHLDWLLLTKRPQNIAKMLPSDWGEAYANVWLGTTAENQTELDRRAPALLAVNASIHFLSCEPLLGALNLRPYLAGPNGKTVQCGCGWRETEAGIVGATPDAQRCMSCGKRVIRGQPINWVIAGGESGNDARPMHPDWARSLRDQCRDAGVPFLFKQWGEWVPHKVEAGGDLGGDVRRGSVTVVHPSGESDLDVFNRTGINTIPGTRYMRRVGKKHAGRLLDGVDHKEFPTAA